MGISTTFHKSSKHGLKCNPLQCLIYLAINKMNADIFGLNVKTKCPGRNKNSFDIERRHSLLSLFNWI